LNHSCIVSTIKHFYMQILIDIYKYHIFFLSPWSYQNVNLHKNNPLFYFVATGLTTKIYYADDPISRTCKWLLNIFYSKTKSPHSINYLYMYNIIYANGRSVDQVLNLMLSDHFFFLVCTYILHSKTSLLLLLFFHEPN